MANELLEAVEAARQEVREFREIILAHLDSMLMRTAKIAILTKPPEPQAGASGGGNGNRINDALADDGDPPEPPKSLFQREYARLRAAMDERANSDLRTILERIEAKLDTII